MEWRVKEEYRNICNRAEIHKVLNFTGKLKNEQPSNDVANASEEKDQKVVKEKFEGEIRLHIRVEFGGVWCGGGELLPIEATIESKKIQRKYLLQ